MAENLWKSLGTIGIAPKGTYNPDTTYYRGHLVSYEGSSYVALKNELTNVTPTDDDINWSLVMKGYNEKIIQATIPSNGWVGDTAPYTQTITVEGISEDDNPVVDIILSDDIETMQAQLEDYGKILKIATGDGNITVYSSDLTTTDLTILMKGVNFATETEIDADKVGVVDTNNIVGNGAGNREILQTFLDTVANNMYYTEGGLTEILPETSLTFDEDGQLYTSDLLSLEVDSTYTVVWNGVSYTCIGQAYEQDGRTIGIALGNLGVLLESTSTDEPFIIIAMYPELVETAGGNSVAFLALDGSTETIVSISYESETVHKLDNKYLDLYWLPTAEEGSVQIYPETTLTYNGSNSKILESNHPFKLVWKDTYTVTWNGIEYTCVAKKVFINESADCIYIGNGSLNTMVTADNTGEPFMIGNVVAVPEGIVGYTYIMADSKDAGEVTVAVSHMGSVPNKLPEEYLPDKITLMQSFDGKYAGNMTLADAISLLTDKPTTDICVISYSIENTVCMRPTMFSIIDSVITLYIPSYAEDIEACTCAIFTWNESGISVTTKS